jgi:uncharacterized protein YraI
MSIKRLLLCAVTAAFSFTAAAQQAQSTKWINLRAGPAQDYPLVVRMGPGTPLAVQGCTSGYGWCDVVGPGDVRGWVYAGNIAYPYQSAEVPILTYGAVIGLPIVTFAIGDYWGRYYRGRPFYGNLPRWQNHRPPPFRPIGPPPRPIVRPGIGPRPGGPPPSVRPPGGGGRPPGGGGRPPGADGGRPPGGGGGRPPGAGAGRPPGGGGGRPPGAGGGRPQGGEGGDRQMIGPSGNRQQR